MQVNRKFLPASGIMKTRESVTENARRIPVAGEYDVAIIGGGTAGVSAAAAAARAGAAVCLVEKTGMLGGLATAGLIALYLPLCDGRGRQLASGMAEELLKLSVKDGPGDIPGCWRREASQTERAAARYRVTFNPATFALSLDGWVAETGAELRFESLFAGVRMDGGRITHVILEEKQGRVALRVKAVVDASGDALVAARAGAATTEESNTLAAWYYLACLNDNEVRMRAIGRLGDKRAQVPDDRRFSGIEQRDLTDFYVNSRKLIAGDVQKIRESGGGREKVFPVTLPTLAQFRTVQHIAGSFQLDEKHDGQAFDDTIGAIGDWRKPGSVFQIPYRALLPGTVDNLLAAGRCVSATTSGLEIVRTIPACSVTGQAAGIAAAISAGSGTPVPALDITALQNALKNQDVIIP